MTLKNIDDDDIKKFFDSAEGEAEAISLNMNMTQWEMEDAKAFNNLPADMSLDDFVDKLFDNFGSK